MKLSLGNAKSATLVVSSLEGDTVVLREVAVSPEDLFAVIRMNEGKDRITNKHARKIRKDLRHRDE